MKPITGSLNATELADTLSPVSTEEAFLGVARGLVPALDLLVATPTIAGIGPTLLAGHIVECLLKAFLAGTGVGEDELKRQFGHSLLHLWQSAQARGLAFEPNLPPWLERLDALHDWPFQLRYPMGLHGLVLPGPEQMSADIRNLMDRVITVLRSPGRRGNDDGAVQQ